MKQKAIFIGIVVLTVIVLGNCAKQNDFPVLKGPYLGQQPPGMTPQVFAPGIISTGYHDGCITFSPDGKELFYHFGGVHGGVYRTVILCMKQENDRWTAPQMASFSGQYTDGEPHYSYDGNTLVFRSERPLEGSGEPNEFPDLWMVRRRGSGWAKPKNLGPTINSNRYDLYPTFSRSGDLYFASDRDGGWDIYVSRFVNGEYVKPVKLGNAINSEFGDWDAYLSPDESYMIFGSSGRSDGLGESDLYISFKKSDGSWTKSKNMGSPLNTFYREVDPVVSPDGKYLFFRSNRRIDKTYSESVLTYEAFIEVIDSPGNGEADIYWVDAKIIEELKPTHLK